MTDAARPPHAVLLRSPESYTPPKLAAALAKREKRPALDFAASARRNWGLAAESLPAEQAEALAADLTAAELPAIAAPASLLESPPPSRPLPRAELSREGLGVEGQTLSWERLAVVCAAALETSKSFTTTTGPSAAERAVRIGITLATGLPVGMGKSETKTVQHKDRQQLLDLLFLEPAARLRLDAERFDYSMLGAKKGYSSHTNLIALLETLTERAPKALRGRGTRALLSRKTGAESLYESLDDLEREERWLLTLAALKAAL